MTSINNVCSLVCARLSDFEGLAISPICVASMISWKPACLEKTCESVFAWCSAQCDKTEQMASSALTFILSCKTLPACTACHKHTFTYFPMKPRELRFGFGTRRATTASANSWAGSTSATATAASASAAAFFFKAAMTFANCSSSPVMSGCFTDFRLLDLSAANKHLAT